jgi:sec-independent protein translocase protein TatA
MGELSPIHWLVVLAIIVLLFGGRKIPEVMRGLGEGVRSFKEGMRDEGPASVHSSTVASQASTASPVVTPEKKELASTERQAAS